MYALDIEFPNGLVTTYDKRLAYKQEMKGAAEIITDDIRLIERIFYQLKSILEKM